MSSHTDLAYLEIGRVVTLQTARGAGRTIDASRLLVSFSDEAIRIIGRVSRVDDGAAEDVD